MLEESANKEEFGNWYTKIEDSNNLLDKVIDRLTFFLDGTNEEDKPGPTAGQSDITRNMLESAVNRNKSFAIQVNDLVTKLITLF